VKNVSKVLTAAWLAVGTRYDPRPVSLKSDAQTVAPLYHHPVMLKSTNSK